MALPAIVTLAPDTVKSVKQLSLSGILQNSLGTEQEMTWEGSERRCLVLDDSKYPSISAYYKDGNGQIVRRLVGVARVVFERAEFVSEFDRARMFQGYVAKHRKYHLYAHLQLNAPVGTETINLQSDLVIYFDPEDQVWRVDQQTPWQDARAG